MKHTYFAALILLCSLLLRVPGAMAENEPREGGLTGTGIVGEITALGSIVVNGHRITFPDSLPVTSETGEKAASALVPGDVVAVAVTADQQGWAAHAIQQIHSVIGPVSAIDGNQLTVLGVSVESPGALSGLKVNDWVAVQGFWTRYGIQATRIESIAPRKTASLQGSYVKPVTDQGTTTIGTATLAISGLEHASPGDVLRVSGPVKDNRLQVTDIYLGVFSHLVGVVLVEGYFSDVAASGHYTVNGSGLSSYTDNLAQTMPAGRVQVCGIDGDLLQSDDGVSDETRKQLATLGCDLP